MSATNLLLSPNRITTTPRARRGATAVIAQYIQDLTHPTEPADCAAVA